MLTRLILTGIFLISTNGFAKTNDLTAGIVFPSDNSSIYENSAQLPVLEQRVEVLFSPSASALEGTFAKGGGRFGFGLGARTEGGSVTGLFGLGFKLSSFRLGVGAAYAARSSSLGIDGCFGFGDPSGFGGAIVVRDLSGGASQVVFGLGLGGSTVDFEVDLDFDTGSSAMALIPGLRVSAAGNRLTVLLGYRIAIENQTGSLRAGLAVWLSNAATLDYYYGVLLGQHTLGLKFSI